MILYHGTDEKSAKSILQSGIDLYAGNERSDFGQGFYTTPDFSMACTWANRKGIFSRPAVVSFLFDDDYLTKDIHCRVFDTSDLVWAQFIANNRNGYKYACRMRMQENNLRAQYDIVIGQTADGSVAMKVRNLRNSVQPVDEETLCDFKAKTYADQYSFHTAKGIALLSNGRIRLL